MTKQKWVQCTEELAENHERVKAWRNKGHRNLRFIAYDKEWINTVIVRDEEGILDEYEIDDVQCLIEVPIQERFVTFYDGDKNAGISHPSLEEAISCAIRNCTHILKITYDGENFQVETVWTKEST